MSTRKIVAVALLAGASVALSSAQPAQQSSPKRTLVRAGHVLDVKTGKLLDGADHRGGRRHHLVGGADRSSVAAQPGDKVIDLGGMTVMPGLIDVHTHLTMNPDFDPYRELTRRTPKRPSTAWPMRARR